MQARKIRSFTISPTWPATNSQGGGWPPRMSETPGESVENPFAAAHDRQLLVDRRLLSAAQERCARCLRRRSLHCGGRDRRGLRRASRLRRRPPPRFASRSRSRQSRDRIARRVPCMRLRLPMWRLRPALRFGYRGPTSRRSRGDARADLPSFRGRRPPRFQCSFSSTFRLSFALPGHREARRKRCSRFPPARSSVRRRRDAELPTDRRAEGDGGRL